MKPEAMLAVATKSRNQGELYLQHGNPGRAFAHFLVSLKLQPHWKEQLKDSLCAALGSWGHSLEQQKRFRDLFHCYEQALEIFPENEEVLNNLGAHLFRLGHVREASHFFRKSLQANPEFLPASCNLESMAGLLVERWHFRMLNDTIRNEAYREAITKKVHQGFTTVLDIGTGTGLLSLFAVAAGADEVYACDCSDTMVQIAQEVLEANNVTDKISLVPKLSNDLLIPKDLPQRVSLVVTETMDSGLLGEHVLQTLADAWERLLLPPCPGLSSERAGQPAGFSSRQATQSYGLVIPLGASVWVAGVECSHISRACSVPTRTLESLGVNMAGGTHVTASREEPYDSEDITQVPEGSKFLSSPQDVVYINFNDPSDIKNCLHGKKEVLTKLSCCEAGRLDAIVAWFGLRLDEDIVLSSAPGSGSCWEQAIFPLALPIEVQAGQQLEVKVNCLAGKLSARVVQEESQYLKLSEDAIRFLNNTEWIEALNATSRALGERKNLDILDLSPFPALGLQLLAQGSAQHVTCAAAASDDRAAIRMAGGEARVEFVDREDLDSLQRHFDVIVLHPISTSGELDQSAMLQIPSLRELLNKDGILLPEKITVWGQLINSPWLTKMSKMENDYNVGGFKIADFVNVYQVSHHLGLYLNTLPHNALSTPVQLLELQPSELRAVAENQVKVPATASGEATAIPYWFEMSWGWGEPVSSRGVASHLCQAAVLLDPRELRQDLEVCVTVRQQHGFIHLGTIFDM